MRRDSVRKGVPGQVVPPMSRTAVRRAQKPKSCTVSCMGQAVPDSPRRDGTGHPPPLGGVPVPLVPEKGDKRGEDSRSGATKWPVTSVRSRREDLSGTRSRDTGKRGHPEEADDG